MSRFLAGWLLLGSLPSPGVGGWTEELLAMLRVLVCLFKYDACVEKPAGGHLAEETVSKNKSGMVGTNKLFFCVS
ncbi:hypothetical protein BKA57DRAFT_451542 [Linnemannia elongata]|nr:hypothetical protein BKA57DRAFT_451542 [Linnemannia elongata]